MHKKKRGQVTVYIIIGIVILFLAILLFYLRSTTEKEMSMQEIVRAQKIPKEARPITNYVATQLDDATKKGLYLIGMQGGYIYQSQGGPIEDPTEEGKDFIYYRRYNVSYNIRKPTFNNKYNYHFSELRYYPWILYPYPEREEIGKKEIFAGFFGVSNLPLLNGFEPYSIESQLKEFITNYLQGHINFSIFDEQGFEINDGEINVSVIIGENDVIAFLEYPLGIKKKITNTITNVTYFYVNPQIRLKKVYNLIHFIVNKDITDILFDITNASNDNISIEKIENILSNINIYDDIIIVKDNKSMLYAEPYEFRFARENRYPALRYLSIPKITFHGPQAIMGATITKNDINPKADDPDEDKIIFIYYPPLPYSVSDSDFYNEYVTLRVYAQETENPNLNEGDWQELKIGVIGYSEV